MIALGSSDTNLQIRGPSDLNEFRPNVTVLTLGRRKFDLLEQVMFSFSSIVTLQFDPVERWLPKLVIKSIRELGDKPLAILYI